MCGEEEDDEEEEVSEEKKTGHKQNQNQARPHRYQVERCAGPVEVQRASE